MSTSATMVLTMIAMTMKIDSPWSLINPPVERGQISARRIPDIGSTKWGLYWGVDEKHQCLLILHCNSNGLCKHRLPRLKGLSVESLAIESGRGKKIIIRLVDNEQTEIFHRFCMDLMVATRNAVTSEEATTQFLTRTWRWHRLLQSGRDGRLSDNEQKGLLGELRVIERCLLPFYDAKVAVESWTGPLSSPKDFQLGLIGIESKTHSPHTTEVSISSADQLDLGDSARLFLNITEINTALKDSYGSLTITDVATRVKEAIVELDISAVIPFEERLFAAGFDWQDNYTDKFWIVGNETLYEVVDGFPKVTPSMILAGVSDIRYKINLDACDNFRVPITILRKAISGA